MKKRYVLDIEGEQRHAVVARRGEELEISVDDGEPRPVHPLSVLGGRALSIRYDGRLHLIHMSADEDGAVSATLAGRPVRLMVMDELRAQAMESQGKAGGSGTLTADIPGLVVGIKVEPGQRVSEGEPVIVVEAMKMQNELCAGLDGTVSEIPVAVGQPVNPGDVLLVVEPDPED